MWYLLIFFAMLFPLTAYVKMKSVARLRRRKSISMLDKLIANETATILLASGVLIIIAAFIHLSEPGIGELRIIKQNREAAWNRLMAQQLAAKLSENLPGESPNVLVIDYAFDNQQKTMHNALIQGLEEGFAGKAKVAREVFLSLPADASEDPVAASLALVPTVSQLDAWQRENDDCTVIVSFVGLPEQYPRSTTMYKVKDDKLTVGVFTSTVYTLGSAIEAKGIQACVVPRQSYVNESLDPTGGDPTTTFANRYLMIDSSPESLKQAIQDNRRMFNISKVIY